MLVHPLARLARRCKPVSVRLQGSLTSFSFAACTPHALRGDPVEHGEQGD